MNELVTEVFIEHPLASPGSANNIEIVLVAMTIKVQIRN